MFALTVANKLHSNVDQTNDEPRRKKNGAQHTNTKSHANETKQIESN